MVKRQDMRYNVRKWSGEGEDIVMIWIVLIILVFSFICLGISKLDSGTKQLNFCQRCGNYQLIDGRCDKCGNLHLIKLPEQYTSRNTTTEGFLAKDKRAEFDRIYIKPIVDKYGVPQSDTLYYCKKCGTIHNQFNELCRDSNSKLQCPVCFEQLYELPDKYKDGIYSRNGRRYNDTLLNDLKSGGEYSEEVALEKQQLHDDLVNSYNERMEAGKRLVEARSNDPKIKGISCPYCHSSNVSKISTSNRAVSVGMVGVASSKIGKQWHCNNCKSNF